MIRRCVFGVSLVAICWLGAHDEWAAAEPAPPATTTDVPAPAEPARVEYNRDIRPILGNNCFKCHGLDAKERKADLRLDISDEARKPAARAPLPIVAGKPDESELVARDLRDRRITGDAAGGNQPSPERSRKASCCAAGSPKGAEYQPHWSFIPPGGQNRRPRSRRHLAAATAIDRFILAKLGARGLRPRPRPTAPRCCGGCRSI